MERLSLYLLDFIQLTEPVFSSFDELRAVFSRFPLIRDSGGALGDNHDDTNNLKTYTAFHEMAICYRWQPGYAGSFPMVTKAIRLLRIFRLQCNLISCMELLPSIHLYRLPQFYHGELDRPAINTYLNRSRRRKPLPPIVH